MSMNFNDPMNPETAALIKEMYGEKIAAMDGKTVLLKQLNEIKQSDMKEITNTANQPLSVEINGLGEIKTMSDGTKYRVTARGWQRVDDAGD